MRLNSRAARRRPRTEVSLMLDRLLAFIPAVDGEGREGTVVLLAGGERRVIRARLRAVLRRICLDLGVSLDVARQNAAEFLGRTRDLPVVLPPGRALACLPVAEHSRYANGYVMADRVRSVLPLNGGPHRTLLVFDDGTELTLKTDTRVVEARLARGTRLAGEMARRWASASP
ncbi:MAG: competence protein ComK [Desulfotomaculales bacterium]